MDIFQGYGVEIKLAKPVDFLVVKETLTRIGLADIENKILFQSCYILHKQGRYVIIHYNELHCLDGKNAQATPEDIALRNKIVSLLEEWELVKVLQPEKLVEQLSITQIKILNFKEKKEWQLVPRYTFFERKRTTG